ncbi:ferredoxin [Ruegeria marisrubri]|uniref:Ferredoxin n=1 Tax=Ruegeria marisrubri TaxID=1685379 RepID=A0A0X3U5W1_9RHOB|nr:(2Fe-2S)-binding protein [Ruegeria marisrubri]KUJ83214.1 ferredoxin [Ruegeria marisrubri]
MAKNRISLEINGEAVEADVRPNRLLSDFLRDDLALTGTKRGCETGVCGACSVLVDGDVVKSCLSLAIQMNGCSLTTVEGLACDGAPSPLQKSFMECGGLQCGYCTPGFLMAASDLLARTSRPDVATIRKNLSGNLCRCTGYQGIVDAILDASEKMHGT